MLKNFFIHLFAFITKLLNFVSPLMDLIARCWVSWIFLKSGWLKITNWDSTIMLFTHEFHVPFLSPTIAAVMGTGAEIILPVLLIVGLGGRISTLIFFVYNIVAVVSYPFLLTPDGAQGLAQHIVWGLLLGLLMCHGSGKLSIDYLLRKKHIHLFKSAKKKST